MYTSIQSLETELLQCRACALCSKDNRGPTSYTGSAASPLMLVGEGPGGVEDEYGVPLVGPSGQLLDKALYSVGITRDRVYTTNVVKCRPKDNRTPTLEESSFCGQRWLDQEIGILRPQVIVALGSVALRYLYQAQARITRDRGKWLNTVYGIQTIATYHPAYLLRLTGKDLVQAKWAVFYDLQAAVQKIKETHPEYQLLSDQMPNLLDLFSSRLQQRKISPS